MKQGCSALLGKAGPMLTLLSEQPLLLRTIVGPRDVVDEATRDLGHASTHDIVGDRHDLDFRRVTVSNRALAGRTLAQIDLDGRYGAHVSRIRRGDTLIVGLVFGRVGRVGPVVTSMSSGAALRHDHLPRVCRHAGRSADRRRAQLGRRAEGGGGRGSGDLDGRPAPARAGPSAQPPRWHRARRCGGWGRDPAGGARPRQRAERLRRSRRPGYVLAYPAAMVVKIVLAQVLARLS